MNYLAGAFLVAMMIGSLAIAEEPTLPEPNSIDDAQILSSAALNKRFNALDANDDGYISQSEARADAEVGSQFINFDETQDNRLNRKEFAKLLSPKRLSIPLPIDLGKGTQPKIEIKPAAPPVDTGPEIAP